MKKRSTARGFLRSHLKLLLITAIASIFLAVGTYLYTRTWTLISPDLPQPYDTSVAAKLSATPKPANARLPSHIVAPEPMGNREIKLPIIMYHYVEYVQDPGDTIRRSLNKNPVAFEAEVKTLKENNYTLYFAKEIPGILSGKTSLASRSAVLTFDDGYEDFYTYAYPVLKKYNEKATIYIVYNFIGRRGFLTKQEIQEMLASGLVEVGSHTLDHLYLKNSAPQVARKQIFESKKALETMFSMSVETFAYPYGSFTQETADIVKEAGYTTALATVPGTRYRADALYYLPRIRGGVFYGTNIAKVLEAYRK